ncbi:serine/threonine-protein kinase [Nocardioides plantarum]|uniref:non-specific serine/threonine protein kinase n=1 Tax=Nocardioides plantarum TaxID=29299 RepID=A0ABV5K5Y3_9ACTN|nr:serine/threonine-protein kinase [Nocardioides plantarum]
MTSGSSGGSDGSDAAWRPPEPVRATASEQLDGYTDLVEIGRGGDSVVYRAREVALGREVAIKVLSLDTTSDPTRAARFAREIEITVQLGRQHPNIVTVLATGTTASGRPAVVMDFFEGGTLHDRLRAYGPLPPEEVGRIGEVLADALSFAHERGVLHRDVKPQNVLVLPTSWVLADFGIARLVDAEHTSSAETFTYRHAAPQILDGHPPTAADDVWSLGSTLFTLLDGRPPFASDDPDEDSALAYLRRARTEDHRPLEIVGAERLGPVIARCLRKDVAERWASAAELRDALHGLRASAWEPTGASGAPRPAPPSLVKSPAPSPAPSPAASSGTDREAAPTPTPTPTPTHTPTWAAPAPIGPGPISPSPISHSPSPMAEPVPLAVSAVSHAAPVHDAEPTGTGLPDATGKPPAARSEPEAPAEEKSPSRRRLPLLLGVGALVIGLALGIVGAVLRDKDEPTDPDTSAVTDPGQGAPVAPVAPGATDTVTGRPQADLAVVLQSFDYDGTNLGAQWTDPSDGEGEFRLLMATDDVPGGRVIYSWPPGSGGTKVTVPIAPRLPTGRACFFMLVKLPTGAYGISDRTSRCGKVTAFGFEQ